MTPLRFWTMVVILAAACAGFYTLSHGEVIPPAQNLRAFPLRIGPWEGSDVELPKRIADATGADEILNRYYSARNADISLYVGYYHSQRTGDTIHSPKNCLPGGGWQPVLSGSVPLRTADGREHSVNLYIVEKGLDRELVLYWYQSHGRMIASEYWAKVYMVVDSIRLNRTDAALVRISTPVAGNEAAARQRAIEFAQAILPQLDVIIPR